MTSSPLRFSLFHLALIPLSFLIPLTKAQNYTLLDIYQSPTFFDTWDFFTGPDPTNGYVTYVDQPTAQAAGLIDAQHGAVYMGVDHTTVLNASVDPGRVSVRITSQKSYNASLIVGDFAHMPGGICGTWPAFWSVGPNWPYNGEIDILEGQNLQQTNLMSLHTGPNCTTAGTSESGTLVNADCYQYSPTESGSGCGVSDSSTISYGSNFNTAGGGVFATEWTDEYIKIWSFPRWAVPADLEAGAPVPANWGTPTANFAGSCDFATSFANHQIVVDTTFCGSWAGVEFGLDPTCNATAPSCNDFVATNPSAFDSAYWLINYVAVYTTRATSSSVATSTTSSAATSTSTPSASPAKKLTGAEMVTEVPVYAPVGGAREQVPVDL